MIPWSSPEKRPPVRNPVRWARDGFYLDDGVRLILNYGHDYAGEILCPESCTDTGLVIPGAHQGLPVREIGDYAFSGCSGLESITIPEGVTAIGVAAFSRCSDLALLLAMWTMSIADILKMEQHEIRRIDVGKCLRRRHDGMPAAGSGAIFAVSV